MGLDEKSDLDCSQVYQAKDGSINYGDKAKQQAQKEWEDEYDSNKPHQAHTLDATQADTIDSMISD